MRTFELKPRFVEMIEGDRPGCLRVTAFAVTPVLALMRVNRCVASDARCRWFRQGHGRKMTGVTGQFFMCIYKCEARFGFVVECCILPSIGVMTTGAIRAARPRMYIIDFVTPDALRSRGLIRLVGVTAGTTSV